MSKCIVSFQVYLDDMGLTFTTLVGFSPSNSIRAPTSSDFMGGKCEGRDTFQLFSVLMAHRKQPIINTDQPSDIFIIRVKRKKLDMRPRSQNQMVLGPVSPSSRLLAMPSSTQQETPVFPNSSPSLGSGLLSRARFVASSSMRIVKALNAVSLECPGIYNLIHCPPISGNIAAAVPHRRTCQKQDSQGPWSANSNTREVPFALARDRFEHCDPVNDDVRRLHKALQIAFSWRPTTVRAFRHWKV